MLYSGKNAWANLHLASCIFWANLTPFSLKALSMYGDMYGWSRIAHMVGTKSESACRVKAGQRQAEQQEEELMV